LLDRLNYLLLSVPVLFFIYKKFALNSNKNLTLLLIVLAAVKPQFAMISVLFLIRGEVRKFFRVFVLQVTVVLSLIVLAGLGDLNRIKEYVRVLGGYGAFIWDLNSQNPPSASLSKGIYLICQMIYRMFTGGRYQADFKGNLLITIFAGCIVVFVLFLLYINQKSLTNLEIAFSLTVVGVLGLGNYVATYYLIFILPIIATVISITHDSNVSNEEISHSNSLFNRCFPEFALAYFFTTTTIIIPNFIFGISRISNSNAIEIVSPPLATLCWFWYIFRLATSRKLGKHDAL
jgi:hypothetical protein